MSCSDSLGRVSRHVSLEEPLPPPSTAFGGWGSGEELGHRPGGGDCVGGDSQRSVGYALPSSTLTAWGLMAPVRAGLAWPAEDGGSGSLLVMAPGAVLPSPTATALRTSRMLFTCGAQDTELNTDGVDQQRQSASVLQTGTTATQLLINGITRPYPVPSPH